MIKKQIFSFIFYIGGIMVIFLLGYSVFDLWHKRDVIKVREQVLEQIKAENFQLRRGLEEAESPEFIEGQARNQLGLSKPGDLVVMMDPINISSKSPMLEKKIKPSWKVWWELFF